MLANILGKSREFIIAHPEIKLSRAKQTKFEKAKARLKRGEPLAYILGYRWFYGQKFAVNKNVLIPRPDTELLADLAIASAKKIKPQIIADIGTGSGAIIISLKNALRKADAKFFGADISQKALSTAKQNASRLKQKGIIFKRGNLAAPVLSMFKNKTVLVCANLPYLSAEQMKEPSIKFEPKLALYGGKNSAAKIEELLAQLNGCAFKHAEIFLEIDPSQPEKIKKAAKKLFKSPIIKIHSDLAGRNRVVQISI